MFKLLYWFVHTQLMIFIELELEMKGKNYLLFPIVNNSILKIIEQCM